MDTNFDKLTNFTCDTSLTSTESGFGSLNGSKTNGVVKFPVDIDLICKIEESKDVTVKNGIYRFKNVKEDTNKAQNFTNRLYDRLSSINFTSLNSFYNQILTFLAATTFILVFLLIWIVFWSVFKDFAFDSPPNKYWMFHVFCAIFVLSVALFFYFSMLLNLPFFRPTNSSNRPLITSIHTIITIFWLILSTILALVLLSISFYLIFKFIIFDNNFSENKLTQNRFVNSLFAFLGVTLLLLFYFSLLRIMLINLSLDRGLY
ncbi:unnamed protein product [Meloidogyne enterolobii]|uniref:Uncharacterized protein n=1 Tax=Meloidogyne enterolobii TaxID=390850 RepID=A0ACB1AWL9_MELEN